VHSKIGMLVSSIGCLPLGTMSEELIYISASEAEHGGRLLTWVGCLAGTRFPPVDNSTGRNRNSTAYRSSDKCTRKY
jgi:hypothetical protein